MAAVSPQLQGAQSPELFLPDDRPPRLTEEAKKEIRQLAALLRQERPAVDDIDPQYESAAKAAGKEIEPKLIYGLLLIKSRQNKQRDDAMKLFEELRLEQPDLLLPLEATAWLRFERQANDSGIAGLSEMVAKMPNSVSPEVAKLLFTWCGQLREFAAEAAVESKRATAKSLASLDAAISAKGPDAKNAYEQGRERTRAVLGDFDKKIASSEDEGEKADSKIERRRLLHYADFPYDQSLREILAGLDH